MGASFDGERFHSHGSSSDTRTEGGAETCVHTQDDRAVRQRYLLPFFLGDNYFPSSKYFTLHRVSDHWVLLVRTQGESMAEFSNTCCALVCVHGTGQWTHSRGLQTSSGPAVVSPSSSWSSAEGTRCSPKDAKYVICCITPVCLKSATGSRTLRGGLLRMYPWPS